MVLNMVASSGEGRVLATPVILTTDNTEASIMSGQQIPIRTGDVDSGGTTRSNYEYKNVGIQLKVKPRINPVALRHSRNHAVRRHPRRAGGRGQQRPDDLDQQARNDRVDLRAEPLDDRAGRPGPDRLPGLNTRVPILGSIPLIGGCSAARTRRASAPSCWC
jgi:hypothetical protein